MPYTPVVCEAIRYGNRKVMKYIVEMEEEVVELIETAWKGFKRNGVMLCTADLREFFYDAFVDVLESYVDNAVFGTANADEYLEGLNTIAERSLGTDVTTLIENIEEMAARRMPIGMRLKELTEGLEPEDYIAWHDAIIETFQRFMPDDDGWQNIAKGVYGCISQISDINLADIDHIHYDFRERAFYVYIPVENSVDQEKVETLKELVEEQLAGSDA